MPFFELPEPAPVDDFEEFYDDGTTPYLPVVLPQEKLLARTDEAAVYVTKLRAYPDGLEIGVASFTRGSLRAQLSRSHSSNHIMADAVVPDDYLRVGVLFSDGSKATNLQPDWLRPPGEEPTCGLESRSGGGNSAEYDQTFWVWPLPTDGNFAIVCEWPASGIPETHTIFDGTELREAGKRAHPVWPDEVGKPSHATSYGGFSSSNVAAAIDTDDGHEEKD